MSLQVWLSNPSVFLSIVIFLSGLFYLLHRALQLATLERELRLSDVQMTTSEDQTLPGKCIIYKQGLFFESELTTLRSYIVLGVDTKGVPVAITTGTLQSIVESYIVLNEIVQHLYEHSESNDKLLIDKLLDEAFDSEETVDYKP